ncbi:UDP-N-acetylmuramoyl-L-alanine--D-glutamate ligase [Candidatus Saccharibacteria bacterium]|nr:UDP-N-acetylmuramoyl-L-alanine--D-glutamate ligase [Candidatus Saccharibacteria bacterium]
MKQAIIDFLTDKSILILGYGREGKSALEFIQQNLPDAKYAVADLNQLELEDVQTFCGENYLDAVKDFDIVIKSPGIPTRDFVPVEQLPKITSLTDLFLRFCPNTIIGVTGTKGKSTTASLTHHILKTAGKNSILIGNIGIACFDAIDQIQSDTIVVFEISCHQLEFVQASPNIAILLNLYEEHFDHYAKPEDYFTAKKNIYKYQNADDTLIYGDIFQHASREEISHLPMHKFNLLEGVDIDDSDIHTHLVGKHNLMNIHAAILACEAAGLKRTDILPTIESFEGLPHRLQYVGEYRKIKFYNDSIATAQEAVINAVTALKNVDTLLLGGMDRGLNYQKLVDFLRHSTVRNIILLPETEQVFQRIFNEAPFSQNLIPVANMAEAVDAAYKYTAEDHICLLSPAAASYNTYKNFEERGEDYMNLVKEHDDGRNA